MIHPRSMTFAMAALLAVIAAVPALAASPSFRVDPYWPKPLPNNWIIGQVGGMAIDSQDNIWVFQRPRSLTNDEKGAALDPPRSKCCVPAPSVLVFNQAGDVVKSWGGPGDNQGYDWPLQEHAILVDNKGYVWLSGNGQGDSMILKFTTDGKFVQEFGKRGPLTSSTDLNQFGLVADLELDAAANEIYAADGYGNHRIAVLDATTGAIKRIWGAYGKPPTDENLAANNPDSRQFASPVHCVTLSKDGLVFVCDRANNRIQVFHKDGSFVRQYVIDPATRASGSTWGLGFSPLDRKQAYFVVIDGTNNVIDTVRRSDGRWSAFPADRDAMPENSTGSTSRSSILGVIFTPVRLTPESVCRNGCRRNDAVAAVNGSENAMNVMLMRWCALVCLFASPAAMAQTYPDHNVTIVVSSSAGALTDVLTRAVAQKLSEMWKQPVIVENRGGAGYTIAAQSVLRAEHDGYMLLASETGFYTTQPHLYGPGGLPYDAEKDFVPVAGYGAIPTAMLVNPSMKLNSVADVIALAKKEPGILTYGTAGVGTALHVAGLELENLAGIKMTAVHYRGAAPALNDLLAGQINAVIMGPSVALSFVDAGKLKMLAFGSEKRVPQFPNVPTIAETVPGYEASVAFGLFAATGTPADVINKVNGDVQKIVGDPDFQKKFLNRFAVQPVPGPLDAYTAYLRKDSAKWEQVIKAANVKLE